jgi:predicted porin
LKKSLIAYSILLLPATAMAELTVEPYGSLRIQAEQVSVDQAKSATEDDSYSGVKDAYSRFGVKASYPLANGTTLGGKIEIPFNLAQMQAEDPSFFQEFYKESGVNNAPRVYKLTASGNWGSAAIGKQWLTYYNKIGYPVDYFSSFYSGFATHATFRREAVTYNSPSFSGVKFAVSAVDMGDNAQYDYLDTMQYAITYNNDGLSLAAAYEDRSDQAVATGSTQNDATDNDLWGVSAAYTTGPWRFATKYEVLENDGPIDDQVVKNIYTSYNMGKYTFKAHYAVGDEEAGGGAFFSGSSYQLGTDYQYTKNLKVFMEYFYEENGYAIYTQDAEKFSPLGGSSSNGSALLVGARYDF